MRKSKRMLVALLLTAIVAVGGFVYAATTSTTSITGVRKSAWTQDTTGAIALTVGTGEAIRIKEIRLGLSAAGGAGDFTAVIDDGDFASIDVKVLTQDMTLATDVHQIFEGDFDLAIGDTLELAYPNANNRTYLLKVVYERL